MKLYLAFVLVFVLVIGTVVANKDKKEQWRGKKEKHQQQHQQHSSSMKTKTKKHHVVGDLQENRMDYNKGDIDMEDPIEFKGGLTKTHKLKHYFGKKKFHKKSKKHQAGKKMKKAHKAMAWLNLRSDIDCDLKCKPGQVCISGPVVNKPICVHKKDLKKSMKMFHRYHKKEMKDWRKYQKKYYKKDWKTKEEKYGKMDKKLNKDEMAALKKEKREKLGKNNYADEKFHTKGKGHFKHHGHHKSKETVCGGSEMAQMKTRMTGWFHLLHGQDKEARKAHGGSIAKFYKHVSVKKELREFNGEKCQCMKSAMWQFHQMDSNHDDHLTDKELVMLEENSLEPCMKPYLDSCDRDGDSKINSDEWCCCFTNVLPPCYKELNKIRRSGKPVSYMPRCDKEGYYMREQCKGNDSDNSLTCWCVDYNGNEYKESVKKGRAHCHKITKYASKQKIPLV